MRIFNERAKVYIYPYTFADCDSLETLIIPQGITTIDTHAFSFCNNINLNINLMNYDFDVIDYVLIHELVHTKIKNHSEKFWLEVEKNCPNYKILRKKLKNR